MNIQAIETVYKGYRFRSRLEARWAVFFDALNIKWQYEVEGFELPSGRYLPDFYLLDYKCYFEIKPLPKPQFCRPRIYMAGRMEEPCWRPFDINNHEYDYEKMPNPQQMTFGGRPIVYTGPFRNELCNHSFLHGLDGAAFGYEPQVFRRSRAGINYCEVLFVYFDDLQAFGTLVEVGIAHVLKKRIVIGFDKKLTGEDSATYSSLGNGHHLWFAAECAEKICFGSKDEILEQFITWLAQQYPLPRELSLTRDLHQLTKSSVYVVYGDPVEAFSGSGPFHFGKDVFFDNDLPSRDPSDRHDAALKARQARFEHGQSGAT